MKKAGAVIVALGLALSPIAGHTADKHDHAMHKEGGEQKGHKH